MDSITQSRFNELARIIRQEKKGHQYKITLTKFDGHQFIHIRRQNLTMMIRIVAIIDRILYYYDNDRYHTPVIRKAIFGINFCKTFISFHTKAAAKYRHDRCEAFELFVTKYKGIIMSARDLGNNCRKIDDNNESPFVRDAIVMYGMAGLLRRINSKEYNNGCPRYIDGSNTLIVCMDTPAGLWIKSFEGYIYDYGRAFYIFESPFSNKFFRVHKENPYAFNDMIDIHLMATLSWSSQQDYDIFVDKYRIILNSDRPGNAFDLISSVHYIDIIICTID